MLSVAQAVTSSAPTSADTTRKFFTDIGVLIIGQRTMVHERTHLDAPQPIEYGT
jgi:hypothetical protein